MGNQWWVTAPWGANEPGKGRESVPACAGLGCALGLPSLCPALKEWERGCHEEVESKFRLSKDEMAKNGKERDSAYWRFGANFGQKNPEMLNLKLLLL